MDNNVVPAQRCKLFNCKEARYLLPEVLPEVQPRDAIKSSHPQPRLQ